MVQLVVMCGLLAAVTIPLLQGKDESELPLEASEPLRRLRRVAEEEIVAEFLRSEFYHPEFDPYRLKFNHLVEHCDLEDAHENFLRRTLLFRRRGGLWRELVAGTEWWEVELTARDLGRLRSFPRNEWRRYAGPNFYLAEMIGRIQAALARGRHDRFLKKIAEISSDLRESRVPNAVLLIGVDEHRPLTIIEGNHRMAAAMLTMPESAHRRFRFYCGLSPNMDLCCWHNTDLRSLTRYARHNLRYMFSYGDFFIRRRLRKNPVDVCDDVTNYVTNYDSDSDNEMSSPLSQLPEQPNVGKGETLTDCATRE
jgi:hypothetical protein